MLRKIRKWFADRKEHRADLKVCKSYWDKDIKVICDTLGIAPLTSIFPLSRVCPMLSVAR